MSEKFEVVVVGGGVIGCSVAHRLADEGKNVLLVESSDALGVGASSAAMGGIIVETDALCRESRDLGRLAVYSRDLLPAWVKGLSDRSGVDVPILTTGDIQLALSEKEHARIENEFLGWWRECEYHVQPLTRRQLAAEEPLLTDSVVAAYRLSAELALEPRRLMVALTGVLASQARVRILLDSKVVGIDDDDDTRARVTLDDGRVLDADTVVVAAGYRSRDVLPEIGDTIFPVTGQAFELHRPGYTTYPLKHHCYASIEEGGQTIDAYAVPRSDGRMAFGVTYEKNVANSHATEAGQKLIRRGLELLIPSATAWPVTREWAGIRPGIANGTPLIGRIHEGSRVIVASGHYGLGVTLAPVTAEMVSAVVNGDADEPTRKRLTVCSPARLGVVGTSPLEPIG